jgi:hypothetical protein
MYLVPAEQRQILQAKQPKRPSKKPLPPKKPKRPKPGSRLHPYDKWVKIRGKIREYRKDREARVRTVADFLKFVLPTTPPPRYPVDSLLLRRRKPEPPQLFLLPLRLRAIYTRPRKVDLTTMTGLLTTMRTLLMAGLSRKMRKSMAGRNLVPWPVRTSLRTSVSGVFSTRNMAYVTRVTCS